MAPGASRGSFELATLSVTGHGEEGEGLRNITHTAFLIYRIRGLLRERGETRERRGERERKGGLCYVPDSSRTHDWIEAIKDTALQMDWTIDCG